VPSSQKPHTLRALRIAYAAQGENVTAAKLAYDRPSMKLLGFLSKCVARHHSEPIERPTDSS
jgi:hypothetical protein